MSMVARRYREPGDLEPSRHVVRQWDMGRGVAVSAAHGSTAGAATSAADFEGLFTQQYEPMVRMAFLLLGSRSEAEDAVQDAFARVQLRWARLDNPGGYLRRCVVNRSYDTLRRRQLEQRLRLTRRPETSATTELGADELSDALATLPAKRRAAVVLRYYAGLREHEIAEALGVRPGTVKSMLHRALAQLREVIER
jgi:RNA polymerase sigma-70 factor (sigma-E family)